MNRTPTNPDAGAANRAEAMVGDGSRLGDATARKLLWLVDASLIGALCVAPYVFGGRHDLGRLVFISFVAVAAAAWFLRQSLLRTAYWHRTAAHWVLLLAAGVLLVQTVPLPTEIVQRLAPRTAELLPMWETADGEAQAASSADANSAVPGPWRTLSLVPHETVKSLAMLVAYGLLFVVVSQRIGEVDDVVWLLRIVAVSSVLMAGFGLLHYFTSDGRFFWFYDHPFRKATHYLSGSFTNRNHFASFLVLGVGPLVAWLIHLLSAAADAPAHRSGMTLRRRLAALALAAALALVVFAVLRSLSRGGALVLLLAATVVIAVYWYRRLVDARYAYTLIALAAVVVGALSLYGYDEVAHRLGDLTEGSVENLDQGRGRRMIWAANIEAFRTGWLTGSGAGSHRVIYPVYLNEPVGNEYTHAENGYLQVATETGIAGAVLLAAAIALCGHWSIVCLRYAREPNEILCFGACAAGLAASGAHSLVDFVWYIPATMSVTVVLAACTLRLAQCTRYANQRARCQRFRSPLAAARRVEMAAAAALVGVWMIHTYVGPAMAEIHWHRYLRASVADEVQARRLLADFVSGRELAGASVRHSYSDLMLRELRLAVDWDPKFARAHARLADRAMAEFERRAGNSANAMDVTQIREAAMAASFDSPVEMRAWLERAFGEDAKLLDEALVHACRTVSLSPLSGEAYLYLADLCFLDGAVPEVVKAYVAQGRRVRPYDSNVLFRAGRQELLLGDPLAAIDDWAKCFHLPGPHQRQIVYRLVASGMPAEEFVARFEPDWRSLREIWARYREHGTERDLHTLVAYAAEVSEREAQSSNGLRPGAIWYWQSRLHSDLGQEAAALACLERAYASDPRQFRVRRALAETLLAAERFAEAEPHVRWCLARQPADKGLTAALATIAKGRLAEREASGGSSPTSIKMWAR